MDEEYLVCVAWRPGQRLYPGTVEDVECGHRAWVSREGMMLWLRTPGMQRLCVECALRLAESQPGKGQGAV